MKRLSPLTLVFAILSLFFFLILIFFRFPFPFYPLMSIQDALDILTSPVLIPVYWLMLWRVTRGKMDLSTQILFMIAAAFWVLGQGMHLSANSINNLIGELAGNQGIDVSGTDLYSLTNFYDEHLSHYLWHIGVLGLAAVLIYASRCQPTLEKTDWRFVVPASVLYGFTYFCIFYFLVNGDAYTPARPAIPAGSVPATSPTLIRFLNAGLQKGVAVSSIAFYEDLIRK